MLDESFNRLRALLIKHEGLRLKAYRCPAGRLTIGVGRNLESVGVSESEAMLMLANDLERVSREAHAALPWLTNLSVTRQDVVLSMIFNLGLSGFQDFKQMIAALERQDYEAASAHMLDSLWAVQVGPRADDLAEMMKSGRHPTIS